MCTTALLDLCRMAPCWAFGQEGKELLDRVKQPAALSAGLKALPS